MAEALLGTVFENLISLVQNEFSTISGIKSKAQNLSTTLDLIKAVLQDAEYKQITDNSIKVWLQQLKDAVYVLDDILDECSIESSRFKGLSSFKPKNVMFRHDIGCRLKEITSRLDKIAESKNKFLLRERATMIERPTEVAEWRQTSSTIAEPKVFGREDDKEKIVNFLLTQARDSDFLSVYPIVGLGGVGKTTLAQLVYNDVRVSNNFNTKIWVCVSEDFSVKRIMCSIIESATEKKCNAFDLEVIQRKLQKIFQGKKYLLVLDDVWNQNQQFEFGLSQEKWNKLKSVLSCGFKGSSILVSTRDNDVATIMGTSKTHRLSGLSDNECWMLFKQYAFGYDKEECPELVEIGKEIVKKCDGLPLAAQALGGLMRSRNGEKEWLEIKESRLWDLPHDNSIMPALRLSYFHLSSTLKQCFAFSAIFPKDKKIMKEELIHLWMANGFISSRENLEVEDVGNIIWNELYQKSFFQDIKMDEYSNVISFKMHDLIHDLAQSVMGKECVILEDANMNKLSKNTHHISFDPNHLLSFDKGSFKKVESLRTLFQLKYFRKRGYDYFPTNCSLRVLCTSSLQVSSLESLIHLRYLELCELKINTLPESIYNLKKLEILKLKHLSNLSGLPEGLACLQNLRHLVIEGCDKLSRFFPNIGKLTSLRTLSEYFVSLGIGHSLAELCDLNLRGKLNIKDLNNVGSVSEAQKANLMGKKDLRELCLSWSHNEEYNLTPIISDEQVLKVLQPHINLKGLKIDCYYGLCLPSWITILRSLVDLELWGCRNIVSLSPLSKLPSLKTLKLYQMNKVQFIDDDESNYGMEVGFFTSLEELILNKLPNLERLLKVERGDMFSCLSKLQIYNCPKLELPCLPSVKDLSINPCTNEFLRHISSFCGLTILDLCSDASGEITSFPDDMLRNLTCLRTLVVEKFPKLKEFPNEFFNPAMECLFIISCDELKSLPEKISEGMPSLRTIEIALCIGLRCLPAGIQHDSDLTSVPNRCK